MNKQREGGPAVTNTLRISRSSVALPLEFHRISADLLVVRAGLWTLAPLTTVTMKISFFWDVTPCSLIYRFRRFGGTCQLYQQNVDTTVPRIMGVINFTKTALKMKTRKTKINFPLLPTLGILFSLRSPKFFLIPQQPTIMQYRTVPNMKTETLLNSYIPFSSLFHPAFWFIKFYSHQLMHFLIQIRIQNGI